MKFTVKYKKQKYKVSLLDKVKIETIKFVLILKRLIRGARRLIPQNLILYIWVTLFWIVFGIITYHCGIIYKDPYEYTIWDTLWELKNSYFTSVVLTLLITSYNQNKGYRDKLEKQHYFYYEIMSGFDKLFKPFIGDEILYYMPFYNKKCLSATIDYIKDNDLMNWLDEDCLIEGINDVLEKITLLKHLENNGGVIGKSNSNFMTDIITTEGKLKKIKSNPKSIIVELDEISRDLLEIVADIRRPWRWDIENDIKILQLLNKENDIESQFYYKMHLSGHTFSDAR